MKEEAKRNNHPVLRWLLLAVVLVWVWNTWQQMQEYALLVEREIFSAEELAEIGALYRFGWVLQALVVLGFLFVFFTWTWDRKSRRGALADSICMGVLALLWAPVPLFLQLERSRLLLWAAVLLALLGGAVWSWWKSSRLPAREDAP